MLQVKAATDSSSGPSFDESLEDGVDESPEDGVDESPEDGMDDVDEPGCAECEGPKLCWFKTPRERGARDKGCNPDPEECEHGINRAREEPNHKWVAYKCKSW